MAKVLVLSAEDIAKVLDLKTAIEAVEEAYLQKAQGKGSIFPLVFHAFQAEKADMDIKSGVLSDSGYFGLKLVSWFGDNPAKGLPALFGTALLCDRSTGEPAALLNASGITGLRTGAAGAIGAKYLAKKGSETMLMVGTGEQAPFQIAAMLAAIPGLTHVELYNPNGIDRTRARLSAIRAQVEALLSACHAEKKFAVSAAENLASAAGGSDIIVTATPSYVPLIQDDWIAPGTHISCIGADMSGKRELDPLLLVRAKIYADDIVQSLSVGECEMPVKEGYFTPDHLAGEIGAVIGGSLAGRTGREVTVFDSTGIALQDIAAAAKCVARARSLGLGTEVDL